MKNRKTIIIGASANSERYAYKAAQSLVNSNHDTYLIGNRSATIFGKEISTEPIALEDVDTVTLYLSPKNQEAYYDYIHSIKPRRVIFNPGTENQQFAKELESNGIKTEEACTLVLLATSSY